jgi:hypothetical protein
MGSLSCWGTKFSEDKLILNLDFLQQWGQAEDLPPSEKMGIDFPVNYNYDDS